MAKENSDFFLSALIGSISGTLSSVLLQPLDRLKTLVQQDPASSGSSFKLAKAVVKSHGFFDMWRGITPTLLRVVPGMAIYFGCLEVGQKLISHTTHTNASNFVLGALSRTTAALLLMPATVIKSRFESSLYRDVSMKAAAEDLFHRYGYKGLYKGTVPTLLRDAPFSGVYLVFYRLNLELSYGNSIYHAPFKRFTCGFIAGIFACAVTQPFDVVKTSLQLHPQQTFSKIISKLHQGRGLAAFFSGFWLRSLRRTLMTALSWTFFDEFNVERQQHR